MNSLPRLTNKRSYTKMSEDASQKLEGYSPSAHELEGPSPSPKNLKAPPQDLKDPLRLTPENFEGPLPQDLDGLPALLPLAFFNKEMAERFYPGAEHADWLKMKADLNMLVQEGMRLKQLANTHRKRVELLTYNFRKCKGNAPYQSIRPFVNANVSNPDCISNIRDSKKDSNRINSLYYPHSLPGSQVTGPKTSPSLTGLKTSYKPQPMPPLISNIRGSQQSLTSLSINKEQHTAINPNTQWPAAEESTNPHTVA